jgi:hypothetical protein
VGAASVTWCSQPARGGAGEARGGAGDRAAARGRTVPLARHAARAVVVRVGENNPAVAACAARARQPLHGERARGYAGSGGRQQALRPPRAPAWYDMFS